MKSWIYKYFGILLMMLSVIIGNYFWEDNLSNSIYSLFWIMLFVFFPGITFYNFGKSNSKPSRLINISLISYFISSMILLSFFPLLSKESGIGILLIVYPLFLFSFVGFFTLSLYVLIKHLSKILKKHLDSQNNSFRQS